MQEAKQLWMNGRLVDWHTAQIHVMTYSFHYSISVYDGWRSWNGSRGPAIFRQMDHVDRMVRGTRVIGMDLPWTREQINQAVIDCIRANGLEEVYVRPIIWYGYGGLSLDWRGLPVEMAIATFPWTPYLGADSLEQGIRARISSYTTHAVNTNFTKTSVSGNYLVHTMASMEARMDGYHEALLLDTEGYVAEGPVQSVFIVRNEIIQVPTNDAIFLSITRDSLLHLARDRGYEIQFCKFPRDAVYQADEVFFCGSASQVLPVVQVDQRTIGNGKPGPVTRDLQGAYFDVVQGRNEKYLHWLTPIYG